MYKDTRVYQNSQIVSFDEKTACTPFQVLPSRKCFLLTYYVYDHKWRCTHLIWLIIIISSLTLSLKHIYEEKLVHPFLLQVFSCQIQAILSKIKHILWDCTQKCMVISKPQAFFLRHKLAKPVKRGGVTPFLMFSILIV